MLVICDGFVLTQLLPAMAFAYTVLLDSVLARPLTPSWSNYLQRYIISPAASALLVGSFLPAMASLNGCYLRWLCLCSCYPRWLHSSGVCGFPFRFDCDGISPYSPSGYPFRFDHDVIAVCFRRFEVARDFCDDFDTCVLVICDGSRLTQLLPALGYPYSCYLHSRLLSTMAFWLMWLLPPLGLLSVLGCLYSCYPRSRLLSTMAFWLMWLLSPLRLLSV